MINALLLQVARVATSNLVVLKTSIPNLIVVAFDPPTVAGDLRPGLGLGAFVEIVD